MGLQQVHGTAVPSTCSGRSCWLTAWQAPLIQGVSHVQCPPRWPLSQPARCRFHTCQEHYKGVWGSGICEESVWGVEGMGRLSTLPVQAHRPPNSILPCVVLPLSPALVTYKG